MIFRRRREEHERESEPVCPYCSQVLETRPKRKKKCPSCGNYIYVRTTQRIFPSTLLTSEDADVADHFRMVECLGLEERDFTKTRDDLAKRFGVPPSGGDVLWALSNRLAVQLMKGQDLGALNLLYFDMALFAQKQGEDVVTFRQQAARTELLRHKQGGIKRVEILPANDACKACEGQRGKTFTIDEALEQMPIPFRECTFELVSGKPGWCRCTYLPVVD